MQMTNQEIWSKYDRKKKETKSKRELKAYRRTLAELNGCSEEEITEIVNNEDNKWISYEGIEPTVEIKHTEARPEVVKAKKVKTKKLTIKKAVEKGKLTHKKEEEEIIAKEYRAYGGVIEGGEKKSICYLAGPITGVPDYERRFKDAEEMVLARLGDKYTVVNPAALLKPFKDLPYFKVMNLCFSFLDYASVVVLLPGWDKSKGACIEYGYSVAQDKIQIELTDLLTRFEEIEPKKVAEKKPMVKKVGGKRKGSISIDWEKAEKLHAELKNWDKVAEAMGIAPGTLRRRMWERSKKGGK